MSKRFEVGIRQEVPLGLRLICYMYVTNVVLYVVSLALFYNRVIIVGNDAGLWLARFVRLLFIFVPIYLYWGLKELKRVGWRVAIFFHVFFILNNASGFLEYYGYGFQGIHFTGNYGAALYTPTQVFTLALNSLVNLIILEYLSRKAFLFQGSHT